jgi:CO/xanthine dehydrogenase FAD-binding subunit
MVKHLFQPSDLSAAQALLAAHPQARPLAGGTFLLSRRFQGEALDLVVLDGLLPAGLERRGSSWSIGAAATFQDLIDSPDCPGFLRQAALQMANRNIRHRATVGGNVGGRGACASLIPALLVGEATLDLAGGANLSLADWLERPAGLISSVRLSEAPDWSYACQRWSRSACDIGLLAAAAAMRLSGRTISGLRLACGGLGPWPRRFAELEADLVGRELPTGQAARAELESRIASRLSPRGDLRGGAGFKRVQAAALIVETMVAAASQAAREAAS